jgi:hypothetical protein
MLRPPLSIEEVTLPYSLERILRGLSEHQEVVEMTRCCWDSAQNRLAVRRLCVAGRDIPLEV